MRHAVLSAVALGVLALTSGCLDSVVSAECAEGLSECDGLCVATDSDPANCGGCSIHCDGVCALGECRRQPAAPVWHASGGASPGDAGTGPSDAGTGPSDAGTGPSDAGTGPSDAGTDPADGALVDDPDAGPVCSDSLQSCADDCVDFETDRFHCGGCGIVCASGLCNGGACSDAISGHVVVIGHDFGNTHAAMNRLLGNAVFLAAGAPVRVVTYPGDAEPPALANIRQALDLHTAATGRSWLELPVVTADQVPAMLAQAQVFLLPAQNGASAGTLAGLGAAWRDALAEFAAAGGVIVVLDGGGDAGGTHQVLAPAGLFVATIASVNEPVVDVVAPADALATGVALHYLAPTRSVAFVTDATVQVVRAGAQPIVIHRPIY